MTEAQYLQAVKAQAQSNNEWSAKQAQKQMDFQREMSNSAHQREVLDLQKAGLNPVLSAMNGNGASTPSGASGETDTSSTTAMASLMSQMLEIEATNARANLVRAGSGYGSGYGGSSKSLEDFDFFDNMAYSLLLALGVPPQRAEAMVKGIDRAGEQGAEFVQEKKHQVASAVSGTAKGVGGFINWLLADKGARQRLRKPSPR